MLVVLLGSVAAWGGNGGELRSGGLPRLVAVSLSGSQAESRALLASVGELLGRLGLRVTTAPSADEDLLASVSALLGDDECTISIARRGAVLHVRRVPRRASSGVTMEAVAYVIQASVEELAELETRTVASGPSEAPPSQPPLVDASAEEPAPSARDGLGVELGAYASGRSFSDVAPLVLGAGIVSALRLPSRGALGARVALSMNWNGPFSVDTGLVTTATQSLSARLMALGRYQFTTLAVEVGLGGGADVLFTSSTFGSIGEGAYLPETTEASPMLVASAGVRARISSSAELFGVLAGELDFVPRRYVVTGDGAPQVVFQTWRVRPALTLGFTFDLWEAK